jgi:hypothetical protein
MYLVDITVLERLSLITDESLDKSKRDMPDEVKANFIWHWVKAEMRLITGESSRFSTRNSCT